MPSEQLGRLYVLVDADGRSYVKGLKDIERETDTSGRRMESAWGKYGRAAGVAAAAGLAGIATTMASLASVAVKTAAKFEYEMSRIKANANGTAAEMEGLRQTVLQLGRATVFTAGETAQAANELIKAGLSVKETISALPGMLNLAAAGELDVAQAAEITANTLAQFSLTAKDAAAVADTLALAANLSTTEVAGLGQSLGNVATIAANMGWSLQETSAALALLANNGVKGAQAGTALKSMLMQLMTPTAQARAMLERYGVSLYDATGQTVTASELIERLQQAFAGLSDADRDLAAGTIFGSYGIRAANILIKEGAEAFDKMTGAVSRTGAAQDIAATKMDNLLGAWTQLKSALETLGIDLGSKALPKLREFVDRVTAIVNEAIETGDWGGLGEGIAKLVGEGISTVTPYVVQLAAEVVPQLFTGVFKGAAVAWWDSFREAAENPGRTNHPADLGYIDPTRIVRATDMVVREYGRLIREGEKLDQAWILQSKQAAAVAKGLKDLSEAGDELSVSNETLEATAKGLETAFAKVYTPLAAWNELMNESKAAAEKAGKAWDLSKVPLGEYLDELEKQLSAWAEFNENLNKLVAEGLSPEAALKAAERGAEFVQLLVGAKPQERERAFALLEGELNSGMEAVARKLHETAMHAGKTAGQKMAENIAAAYHGYDLGTVLPKSTNVDLTKQGEAAGKSFVEGVQKAFGIGVSLKLGVSPAGGMDLQGLIAGQVPGLARSTASVWTTLKSIHPFAQWLGGYASSGHVKGSDHYTGHAFDVGGTPAQLQAIANTLARNFQAWGIKQIIYNRQQNRGSGWYPYKGANPHTGHVHVGTYADGGWVLPPARTSTGQAVPAILHAGEYVLTQNQAEAIFGTAPRYADGGWVKPQPSFSSYISRESSRYRMYEAEGAPVEVLEQTLINKIAFIEKAVAEAQAHLDAAKAAERPAEEINDLAERLFDLRREAAGAKDALDELARVPLKEALTALEQVAAGWSDQVGQVNALMDILGHSSVGAGGLADVLMSNLAALKDANLALMSEATDPADIRRYGNAAADAVTAMWRAQQASIEAGLREQTDTVNAQRTEWEEAWRERADAMQAAADRQRKALQQQLSDLREANRAAMQELRDHYAERLRALEDTAQAEDRAAARRQTAADLATLYAQGGWSSSDVERIWALRRQQQDRERQWSREDARRALQDERDLAIAQLEQQQAAAEKALEAQIQAYEEMQAAQRAALEAERQAQDKYFRDQISLAEQAARAQLDITADAFAAMLASVFSAMNQLTGAASTWSGTLGGGGADEAPTLRNTGIAAPISGASTPEGVAYGGSYLPSGSRPGPGYVWNEATGHWISEDELNALYTPTHPKPSTLENYVPTAQMFYWNPATGRWQTKPVSAADLGGTVPVSRSVNEHFIWNPVWQRWDQQFRSPSATGLRVFDEGGWLPPGISTVANYTGQYERVTPMRDLVGIGSEITVKVHVTGDGTTLTEDGVRQLRDGLREDVISQLSHDQFVSTLRQRRAS